MRKRILFAIAAILLISANISAQEKPTVYNVNADAAADVAAAVKKAKAENKHVLLQLGGNWCIWCLRFHKLVNENDTLKKAMNDNYIVVHVNYSKENKNEALLAKLGYPQRFGFPVFVILDGNGNRLHTQNSAYLEEGNGHSVKKVLEFFEHWSPKAIDPASYTKSH
ncbi:thioredoxin family protein [Filimonas effusa]|uniref:Thioredoxin family protein n=1 Tax=Filimonas effusa TaxID=2508721 RepID=A0A4Q1D0Q7_9BACT|nr:thioredoxin family protein [Filimonas effusa]RXK81319.1 thioredoxin family protein [Filimonas effusa]